MTAALDPVLCVEERVRQRDGSESWQRVENHPLLALLRRPNQADTFETFLSSWIVSENLTDVFYAEIVRSSGGRPIALFPLHPGFVFERYKYDREGSAIDYFEYYVDGAKSIRFAPENILCRRRHGFANVYTNHSPLSAALGSVDADTALNDYVRAFFNNGGRPSGVLTVKNRKLDKTEADQIKQNWTNEYGRRGRTQQGIAVLDANADYQNVGAQLEDLDSETLRGQTETRICMTFGVPPILVGAYTALKHVNQRASVGEAQKDFWKNTMSPELKSIRNFLTWELLTEFETETDIAAGKYRVNWDMSQVEALQESQDALFERAGKAYKVYRTITLNESREMIGRDPVPNGDKFCAPDSNVLQLQRPDNERDETDDEDEAKLLPPPAEKKNVTIDGVALSREPNDAEAHVDFKRLFETVESNGARLAKVLLKARTEMAAQAVAILRASGETQSLPSIELVVPDAERKQVERIIAETVTEGRRQIQSELAALGKIDGRDDSEFIRDTTQTVLGRFLATITERFINLLAWWLLIGRTIDSIIEMFEPEIEAQSTRWVESLGRDTANAGMQAGRARELREREGDWQVLEYSAILDANTCVWCKLWDAKQATRFEDLPPTPNPECEGGPHCRCFIVAITV